MSSPLPRACLVVCGVVAPWAQARADDDFLPTSTQWNGVATLLSVSRNAGTDLEPADSLDLADLAADDGVLLLEPRSPPPVAELSAFMRRGGRVALADDYGRGDALFDAFHIARSDPDPNRVPRLRGNRNLLLAEPISGHPLSRNVAALAANHPTALSHAELAPIFAFRGATQAGLVLSGAVGAGRLVAIGDPSIFINNMLELDSNRRFAENLLRYLSNDGRGRVVLLTRSATIRGTDATSGRGLGRIRSMLASLASLDLPPLAAQLAALVLAALLLIASVSTLPQRSPYRADRLLPRFPSGGGGAGRVAFFSEHRDLLAHVVRVYKLELESAMLRAMQSDAPYLPRDVGGELVRRGLPKSDGTRFVALLEELDGIARADDASGGKIRVSTRRFCRIVREGERLLAAVRSPATRPAPNRGRAS